MSQTLINGPWEPAALVEAVEESGGLFEPVQTRTEDGGGTARLRGSLKVKAGKAVAAGGLLLTVRPNCCPKKQVQLEFGSTAQSEMLRALLKPNGELTMEAGEAKEGTGLRLDGNTWNLT